MKVLLVLLVLGMLVAGIALTGDRAYAQQYPQVAELKPFTAEAGFMSLPGYLRWQVFVEQGKWIGREEAAEVVAEQVAAPK